MVKSIIDLDERESRIINIVKAKYGLKDKSQALSIILKRYEECELEPALRPEFVKEIEEAKQRGKFVKVKDFAKEFEPKKSVLEFAGTWKGSDIDEVFLRVAKDRELSVSREIEM